MPEKQYLAEPVHCCRENGTVKVYSLQIHDYSLKIISRAPEQSGFKVEHSWNSLSEELHREEEDWIAIAARKI